jgi:hypothetical protein
MLDGDDKRDKKPKSKKVKALNPHSSILSSTSLFYYLSPSHPQETNQTPSLPNSTIRVEPHLQNAH